MGISDWSSDVCSSDLVPDRIAAGFPDGYLVFVKLRPQFRCALQAHKMNLNILPGSQVKVSRSIFIRNIGDGKQFPESQEPKGYFDPDHLYTFLALSVNAPRQTQAATLGLRAISFMEGPALLFKFNDITPNNKSEESRVGKECVRKFR